MTAMDLHTAKPASPASAFQEQPPGPCPDCQGSGFIPITDKPGKVAKCACTVKREVLAYLTPIYAQAVWDCSLDASALQGRNVLLENWRETIFKNLVKSFLLNFAMVKRFSHLTVTP